ncbi:hypothetical protein CMO89_01560 [Candidatus Woesearchaeota archaeon]|nr:hypothetical protein [Candidatus Woesearchaeota archaeon]|tara:strand:+ start:10104 stop:10853 length:750 start_codon:yes stop_codon:yes gene_type:complete
MKCILLAAGYATRLYPLTENQPKPLLKISGKPIIEHIIEKVDEIKEIDEIFIVTNNKFFEHFNEWNKGFSSRFKIKILNDGTLSNDDRLGAIGDLNFVIKTENINEDFLQISGDNLFQFGLKDMHKGFDEKKNISIALYDVRNIEEAKKLGICAVDENSKVIDFEEKPAEPKSTLCSIGVYFYPKATVELLNQYLTEGNSSDMPGKFMEWLHKRSHVHGFVFDKAEEKWFDIGSFEALEEAKREYEQKV